MFKFQLRFRHISPLLLLLGMGCNFEKVPKFEHTEPRTPSAPDYADLRYWAAHPAKSDAADNTPNPGIVDQQGTAQADVFFLHPTTFFGGENWNGDLHDEKLNRRTDSTAILHQASIFNGSCRVYAPRYRQMVYGGFFVETPEDERSARKAAIVAYRDVDAAFQHYLAHENQGRPLIIAAHSQGTALAIRLIHDYYDTQKLNVPLIAAYLPGWGVRRDTFQRLPPCQAADDIGCFVSWCSYEWGAAPKDPDWYTNSACINPILWTNRPDTAQLSDHKGLVMRKYHQMHTQAVSARVHENILWVKRPDVPGKWIIRGENFHIGDFNLFWMDVRENVATRVQAYLKRQNEP